MDSQKNRQKRTIKRETIKLKEEKKNLQKEYEKKEDELSNFKIDFEETVKTNAKVELKTMEKLIAWISHEIKNQLDNAVMGLSTYEKFLNKLVEKYPHKLNHNDFYEIKRNIVSSDIAARNIKQANRIIHDLQVISSKQTTSDIQEINIGDFIHQVFEKIRPPRDEKTIDFDVTGDTNVKIKTYKIALDQIFTNLMLNSLKHGFKDRRRGIISIDLKVRQNKIEVAYCDNGFGIKMENKEKIFEPFYSTLKASEGKGTGLGMTIIKTIITRDFEGTIRLKESLENQRTIFDFILKRFDGVK